MASFYLSLFLPELRKSQEETKTRKVFDYKFLLPKQSYSVFIKIFSFKDLKLSLVLPWRTHTHTHRELHKHICTQSTYMPTYMPTCMSTRDTHAYMHTHKHTQTHTRSPLWFIPYEVNNDCHKYKNERGSITCTTEWFGEGHNTLIIVF